MDHCSGAWCVSPEVRVAGLSALSPGEPAGVGHAPLVHQGTVLKRNQRACMVGGHGPGGNCTEMGGIVGKSLLLKRAGGDQLINFPVFAVPAKIYFYT